MEEVYERLRRHAREVARELGIPSFYRDHDREVDTSLGNLVEDRILSSLRTHISQLLEDDFGHGARHALLVTRDAGALVLIRAKELDIAEPEARAVLRCTQAAGLLHDVRRKEPSHALKSAEASRSLLDGFDFTPEQIEEIAQAIANHEAFQTPKQMRSRAGQVMSDCLYDADKFRWGPDNFTDTVWYMASFYKAPFSMFRKAYQQGIEAIERIKDTFRTPTGRTYGAEIIDMGLAIGRRVISPLIEET
jgi:hypothetical protein